MSHNHSASPATRRNLRVTLLSAAGVAACVAVSLAVRQAWETPAANAGFPLLQSSKHAAEPANAREPQTAAKSKAKTTKAHAKPAAGQVVSEEIVAPQQVVLLAVVNGERIERPELARQCLRHFGKDVLESMINKRLIASECERRNIAVTHAEVKEEMDRMARRFSMPTDQLLTMLREERRITPEQYAREIIWPTVALRKLASDRLKVTQKDFDEAFDMLYGEAVQTRLIACPTAAEAEKIRRLALANPEDFGNLAKQYSIDTVSASAKGLIQPIHHHQGDPNIERVAFALEPDQISEVIQVGDQFVILKCETHLAPQKVDRKKVEKVLIESIRDKKLRLAADTIFKALQDNAQIENVMNDSKHAKAQPGVAAIVNGDTITVREVAEEAIDRHGIEMLEGLISRHLLEQALKRRKINVSEADMQEEIGRAAVTMGRTTKDDKPDVEAWLKDVVENQKLSLDLYRDDVVWPSVALRKLAGEEIEVSEEDLKKSFEANYGPRVRCRAIVLANQRDAQKIWDSARKKPTVEHFAELARLYTIEPGGKANEGEVPPIQRFGSEPLLEQEAFTLKKGEISGIVQVGDKWVILFCEGRTKPVNVKYAEVEKLMQEDILDKKMRLAMAQYYSKLQDEARVENYLTHSVQNGAKAQNGTETLLHVPEGSLLAPDNDAPHAKQGPATKPGGRSAARPATGAR